LKPSLSLDITFFNTEVTSRAEIVLSTFVIYQCVSLLNE
jgi:hypothetical protein